MIAELDANRQMFTVEHIWEPGIMRWGCQRCGFVGSGMYVSPARDAMDISSGHKSGKQFALGAIGIKSKTPEQKAKTEAYKTRRNLRARRRQLQRGYLKTDYENSHYRQRFLRIGNGAEVPRGSPSG